MNTRADGAEASPFCASSSKDIPQRGRAGRKPDTRELTVSGLPFVIIYRAEREVSRIIRILHGAQQRP
ncbi:MAG: hypothetical protein EXQ47_12065 [Bryobacterales bacterium]|nr:hypothetical protein [Bryobacterales bacterium]